MMVARLVVARMVVLALSRFSIIHAKMTGNEGLRLGQDYLGFGGVARLFHDVLPYQSSLLSSLLSSLAFTGAPSRRNAARRGADVTCFNFSSSVQMSAESEICGGEKAGF
jgi:hypothetical protein